MCVTFDTITRRAWIAATLPLKTITYARLIFR